MIRIRLWATRLASQRREARPVANIRLGGRSGLDYCRSHGEACGEGGI